MFVIFFTYKYLFYHDRFKKRYLITVKELPRAAGSRHATKHKAWLDVMDHAPTHRYPASHNWISKKIYNL